MNLEKNSHAGTKIDACNSEKQNYYLIKIKLAYAHWNQTLHVCNTYMNELYKVDNRIYNDHNIQSCHAISTKNLQAKDTEIHCDTKPLNLV